MTEQEELQKDVDIAFGYYKATIAAFDAASRAVNAAECLYNEAKYDVIKAEKDIL
tara:strand:+ start:1677 stop:1841 length:165 start_codon:yes stop_codon:yes gene_type:complete